MSTPARPIQAPPDNGQPAATDQAVAGPVTEYSLISRFVAILTPLFAIAAGWIAGVVAKAVPGAHLNQSEIVSFMVAASVSAIAAGWKWLQGWQQHEQQVADGKAKPLKSQ
jgi:hypothetical protein